MAMKVNRHTIENDVRYWYSKLSQPSSNLDPFNAIMKHIFFLEIQKSKLREQLDHIKEHNELLSHERLIFDIDSELIQTYCKISESIPRIHDRAIKWFNNYLKEKILQKDLLLGLTWLWFQKKPRIKLKVY
jgi:hypothetical protein